MTDRATFNIAEAAEYLGLSKGHFRRHVLPKVRVIRLGRRVLVTRASLDRWVDAKSESY